MNRHLALLFLCLAGVLCVTASAQELTSASPVAEEKIDTAPAETSHFAKPTVASLSATLRVPQTKVPKLALLNSLGDAPSATTAPNQDSTPAEPTSANVANWAFHSVNAVMLASTVANAEAAMNCPTCTSLPSSLHHRTFFYGVGLPVDLGLGFIGYDLKKKGHRWWFVPALAMTAANAYLTYHWTSRAH